MKAVLFDLDGVITSERIYWNCSGLAFARFRDMDVPEDREGKVRLAQKLLPDTVIKRFKEAGINSNWDITYAISVLNTIGKDVNWFLDEVERRGYKGLDYLKLLDELDPSVKHDREGGPWEKAHKKFQQCYYELEETDEPAIPLEQVSKALEELKGMGFRLGIVTGRPYKEAELPLKRWGLWDYFEKGLIVTETEVSEESKKRGEHLGKPNPYPILRAIFANEECDECDIEKIRDDYVFVGDSVSDVVAAKRAGIPVICVNTGIAGEESLRKAGADLIVEDLSRVPEAIKGFRA